MPASTDEFSPLTIEDYAAQALTTDQRSDGGSLTFPLLGLFGETDSLLSEVKKKQRDRASYVGYAGKAVAVKMRATRVNDFYNKDVEIRSDGRVMHKTYVMKVKSPAESKKRGDFYRVLAETPGEQSFRPLAESPCPLVQRK